MIRKLLLTFLDADVKVRAREVAEGNLTEMRRVIQRRRAGTPQSTPQDAINHLVDQLERADRDKNMYAQYMWELVNKYMTPEEIRSWRAEKFPGSERLPPPYGG